MSHFFAKPENALKRAEELIAVGQKNVALQALHDVITSKRHRTWQKVLEKIMLKYIDLCVELRKGKMAKDGLIQYRMICQQVNVGSLEEVIRHFLKLSEERAKEAQSKADQTTLDIDDLEAEETPESLMLSSVSGENTRDRADRELVTPWLKFLWETYRTVLEILRHNAKLETVYQDTAQQAFAFCLKYKRNTEFRRLCDILRTHLANLNKYSNQQQNINLNSPESMQLHLETRFSQLNVATELELWQEAYRSIEDIHGLMSIAKKVPKPSMMATYYQKLTQIFWVSENYLFHAYAWYKLYNLSKAQNKNLSQDDLRLMVSSVLLAALSIPLSEKKAATFGFEFDLEKEKNLRMATLLGFSLNPRREALLAELVSKNILNFIVSPLKDLYQILEVDFHPLDLAAKMKPIIDFLSEHTTLKQYVKPLERLVLMRLLKQLAEVYQTMKISEFSSIAAFISFEDAEQFIVEAVTQNHLHVRIDHQNGTINFGAESIESDKVRNQLVILGRRLAAAAAMIQPDVKAEKTSRKSEVFAEILRSLPAEHRRLIQRKAIIEKRKEEQELYQRMVQKEEEAQNFLQRQLMEKSEAERLAAEARKREAEAAQRERELQERKELMLIAEEIARKKGKNVKAEEIDVSNMDKNQLKREHLKVLSQDRQEMERRLQTLSKRLDHLERARREEERPLLEQQYEEQQAKDLAYYQEQVEIMIATHKHAHAQDVAEKHRLIRMAADAAIFESGVVARRTEVFSKKKQELMEKQSSLQAKRNAETEKKRKEDEAARLEEERLERLEQEEEAKRIEEEERARKAEEEKRRKVEEEDRAKKAKLDEIADRQRKREEEIERKLKEKEEAAKAAFEAEKLAQREREREAAARKEEERPRAEPERFQRDESWRRRDEPSPPRRGYEREERPREPEGVRRPDDRDRDGGWRREDRFADRGGGGDSWRRGDREPERAGPGERGGRFGSPERDGGDRFERRFERADRGSGGGDRYVPPVGRYDREAGDRDRAPLDRAPGPDRGYDRDRGRDGIRPREREFDRGGGFERGSDRAPDRGGYDRGGYDRDRGGVRGGGDAGSFSRGPRAPERDRFEAPRRDGPPRDADSWRDRERDAAPARPAPGPAADRPAEPPRPAPVERREEPESESEEEQPDDGFITVTKKKSIRK